ncbi:Glu/Leu/Phe/Val dehydrogenase [Parachlamydia sp. AcF125]|uniref:Glu/Leu/Phe/Val family dehydrogenase n=1 Tax=Parachlamydia sp. AcF125 TaxID=2795736 RepID=UPI001BCA3560|nr:Glu/Leu/Phe/Val dehydrogenase [Parachlamydia sp. AcF125]MBS4167754.1 Leucine dehydrogenase [Parachlamydia sp. AcF125]
MVLIKKMQVQGYEHVVEGIDQESGLHCFVAIHDSSLGPALGGVRIYPYNSPQDALNDVLRLAKGMTYKSAAITTGLGGGKSVIIANPRKDKSEALWHAFSEVLNSLGGNYIAAEDVGSSIEDMNILRLKTPYVAASDSEKSSGDPSRFTARGVYRGLQAVAQKLWNHRSLAGRRVAIQGLGNVGAKLADILFWEGAELILTDTDEPKLKELALLYGAKTVPPAHFMEVPCDVLCPCALGAILNEETIPQLRCLAIAGAANNQLRTSEDGWPLLERNILYAPDYIINSGGVINAAAEYHPGGYDPKASREKVDDIFDTLSLIFERSEKENKPTNLIADELAESNLKNLVGKRTTPIIFH